MYRIHTSLSSMHCCVGCYCRYGQMTAGSYCYIGPQGIVHGTVVRHWGRVCCQYLLEAGISGVAGDCSGMVCCERMFWLPKKFSLLKKNWCPSPQSMASYPEGICKEGLILSLYLATINEVWVDQNVLDINIFLACLLRCFPQLSFAAILKKCLYPTSSVLGTSDCSVPFYDERNKSDQDRWFYNITL